MVSDYDLLALDKLGQVKDDRALFPAADQTWQVSSNRRWRWAWNSLCLLHRVEAVRSSRSRAQTFYTEGLWSPESMVFMANCSQGTEQLQ